MKDFLYLVADIGIILGAAAVIIVGVLTGASYLITGNALAWTKGPSSCSESVKVVDHGTPVSNIGISTNDGTVIAFTGPDGIAYLPHGCYGTLSLTYQGTRYAFGPEDGKTIEVQV